jgi:hypothetical protein
MVPSHIVSASARFDVDGITVPAQVAYKDALQKQLPCTAPIANTAFNAALQPCLSRWALRDTASGSCINASLQTCRRTSG